MTRSNLVSTAATDRNALVGQAYADDRNLAARQGLYAYQKPRHDLPAAVVELLAGARGPLVDVGCGNGRYVGYLREHRPDLTVVGVDLSAGMLAGIGSPVLVADAAGLPMADGSAGVVLAMHMLYHLPDIEAGLRELTRVVADDGVLVVATNARGDKAALDELWSAAVAEVRGAPDASPPVAPTERFTVEDAAALLPGYFASVRTVDLSGTITVSEPEPVLGYLRSCRSWFERNEVPFDETVDTAERLLRERIDRDGAFRVATSSGIVACRGPLRS